MLLLRILTREYLRQRAYLDLIYATAIIGQRCGFLLNNFTAFNLIKFLVGVYNKTHKLTSHISHTAVVSYLYNYLYNSILSYHLSSIEPTQNLIGSTVIEIRVSLTS